MLKRIAIDIGIIFGVVLLGFGYLWLKDLPERRRARKEAEQVFADLNVQANELKTLGNVDLDPARLTFAELERQLHQPNLTKAGASNSTRVGWACADEHCVILASFLTPFGTEIQPDAIPAALMLMEAPLGDARGIGIGGIRLGDSEDQVLELIRQKGLTPIKSRQNRVHWDKNWDVEWGSVDKRIGLLIFVNESLLQQSKNGAKATASTPAQ